MPDEPTLGELSRQIVSLARSVDALAGKVLTVDVWKAERELMEHRLNEIYTRHSDLKADTKQELGALETALENEKVKRSDERATRDKEAAATRRWIYGLLISTFVGPIMVGVVIMALGGN